MCLSAAALSALSLAGTVGSTLLSGQAAKRSEKNYNNQVRAQNDLLQRQYQDRQNKINQARNSQAELFKNIADSQDEEFAKQRELAAQKEQIFQNAAADTVNRGALSPDFDQAVDERKRLFQEQLQPTDYGISNNGSVENKVLRIAADNANAAEQARSGGIADALARMGALQDVQQKQGGLFRNLTTGLNDVAQTSAARQRLLESKLRAPQYRMGALGAVMGEQQNTPYYRGVEPVFKRPNTIAADILGGASSLAGMYAFRQPAPQPAPQPQTVPVYGPFQPGKGPF